MKQVGTVSQEVVTQAANFLDGDGELRVGLNLLGSDLLAFLFSTIAIVPLFKFLKESPVIGFLAAGLMMGPAGFNVFHDLNGAIDA